MIILAHGEMLGRPEWNVMQSHTVCQIGTCGAPLTPNEFYGICADCRRAWRKRVYGLSDHRNLKRKKAA